MPTPDLAPSAQLLEKILPEIANKAGLEGWSDRLLTDTAQELQVSEDDLAQAFPDGIRSFVPAFLQHTVQSVSSGLEASDFDTMRIRDKVTTGVTLWFEALSRHHDASVKAIDWCTARPLGPLPMTELIWHVADTIWKGIGDADQGFTYMSKRTTLSAVLGSTLAVWRKSHGFEEDWKPFLDRRIEDVMSFEKFKARLNFVLPA